MSTLARYRKPGGFAQLVKLLEGLDATKRAQLLNIIGEEDTSWVSALQEKMLSFEIIMSWPDEALLEVLTRCKPLTIGTALQSLPSENQARVKSLLPSSTRAQVMDILNYDISENAKIQSAVLQLIQEVRELILDGHLQLKSFAPELWIPEDIEEDLKHGSPHREAAQKPKSSQKDEPPSFDMMTRAELLKNCERLQKENNHLRHKVQELAQRIEPAASDQKSAA